MAPFDAWFNAIIVLDANALLNLHERSAESSEELLDILESLSEQIYIPRQFYDEYQNNLPAIANRVSKQYRVFGNNLDSYRDNTVKILFQLPNQNNSDIASFISDFNELYQKAGEAVSSGRKQHIARLFKDNTDTRIIRLIDDKVGDPLPDSLFADIPMIWQWRLDQKIPPGLKDHNKPELRRYGDLIGWFQIKCHAIGRGRPVIMVTDDVKANDWFVLKNGNPSGPHPELTRELYDEAGVELHLYTSEQFMLFARMYLKARAMAEAAGEYFRRLTPTLLPDFGKIAATGSLSALTARVGIFNDYRHSLNALPGLTAGVTNKGLLDSISAVTAFSEIYKPLHNTMAVLTAGVSSKGLLDSISAVTAFSEIYKPLHNTMAVLTAGVSSKGLLDSISAVTAFSEIYKPLHNTMAVLTAGVSSKGLFDSISAVTAFADIFQPVFEQQRSLLKPILQERQRRTDAVMKPIFEEQQRRADAFWEEQQRRIDKSMKPSLKEQRRIADNIRKNLSS